MLPITVIKDINYGPEPIVSRDPQRELDIYYSSSDSEDQPVILFVHGGAWRTGDKSEHTQLAENLARQGFTVAVNNYRLSLKTANNVVPVIQHPDHIRDTMDAVKHLQGRYSGRKLFLVGHSAGAHIILSIALKPEFQLDGIDGFVGVEGIYDIPLLLTTFPDYRDFIEQAFTADETTYTTASVVGFKAGSMKSPIALLHSPDDELIDPGQHQSLYNWLQTQNIAATVNTRLSGKHDECLTTYKMTEVVSEFIRNHI
ncbi:hypothetical protein Unana1_03587 [Umbelopsis nana]